MLVENSVSGGMMQKMAVKKMKTCNICGKNFVATAQFLCFCRRCKVKSEIYKNSEWLQETSLMLVSNFFSVKESSSIDVFAKN